MKFILYSPRRKKLIQKIKKIKLIVFDFDGVFTNNFVYVFEDGKEAVRCSRAEGLGLKKIKDLGIKVLILSTEKNPVVTRRAEKLEILCIQGCNNKADELINFIRRNSISLEEVAYVGNDINDKPCLEIVALPIIVNDAHPDIRVNAVFQTRARGGEGAVREICDLFEKILLTK